MTKRFAEVYEAEADFRTATELADRVLLAAIDWLDVDLLTDQRSWIAADARGQSLTWKSIKRLASGAGIKAHHGHFQGEPGLPDAVAARRAIEYLVNQSLSMDAIVLVRDQDDQPERRVGLEQARRENHQGPVIVLGLAVVERECWVISGFDPQDEGETVRLEVERKTLGFDPRHRSHELTACKNDQAPRSPKRVLRQLSGDDLDRERHCWVAAPLESLRDRGGENGLASYLEEVRNLLAPLIGHVTED
jgi:hypothetical protein